MLSGSISRYWDRLLKVRNLKGERRCSDWNIELEPLRTEVARPVTWIAMCRAVKVHKDVVLIFLLRVVKFLNLRSRRCRWRHVTPTRFLNFTHCFLQWFSGVNSRICLPNVSKRILLIFTTSVYLYLWYSMLYILLSVTQNISAITCLLILVLLSLLLGKSQFCKNNNNNKFYSFLYH